MKITPTELNAIHAEWMALDLDAEDTEKQRVFRLMDKVPKSHISRAKPDEDSFMVIVQGQPAFAFNLRLVAAQAYAKPLGIRTDILWDGHSSPNGQWISVNP